MKRNGINPQGWLGQLATEYHWRGLWLACAGTTHYLESDGSWWQTLAVQSDRQWHLALIGIPWYNVIGNHDINYDARTRRDADLKRYRKHPRGPKKPKPRRTRFAKKKHISTAKLLAAEKAQPNQKSKNTVKPKKRHP